VDGYRHAVISADGTRLGLLTAGRGPALLLVHGGMSRLESWQPVWAPLTRQWRVTAMDRRGRGSSGDTGPYAIEREFEDVSAVAAALAAEQGRPVDAFAHSFGATAALGAAAGGAPFRRLVVYEPPGPRTVPAEWIARVTALIAAGQVGRAMASFLTGIIGLSEAQIDLLRAAPGAGDALAVAAATMPREAQALGRVDLPALARSVPVPVRLLLGERTPAWAGETTRELAAVLAEPSMVLLPGLGHAAIDAAPDRIVAELRDFLAPEPQ
jgi:pimeloyl-ACP methyl ester carboxylesterase